MKKVLSIGLIGVFALSFVAGILVSKSEAVEDICYMAGDCDCDKLKVYTCCRVPTGKVGQVNEVCKWSSEYFVQWCGDICQAE